MSRPKTHVRKGDEVEVITGEHKGARGKVLAVLPAKGHVLVEGVRRITPTAPSSSARARSTSPTSASSPRRKKIPKRRRNNPWNPPSTANTRNAWCRP